MDPKLQTHAHYYTIDTTITTYDIFLILHEGIVLGTLTFYRVASISKTHNCFGAGIESVSYTHLTLPTKRIV